MIMVTKKPAVEMIPKMPAAKPKPDEVPEVAAWPLTTSLVFRAQLGAQPDTKAALN